MRTTSCRRVLLAAALAAVVAVLTCAQRASCSARFSADDWRPAYGPSVHPLVDGRTSASALILNNTFVVIGGCHAIDCYNEHANLSLTIAAVDVATGVAVDPVATLGFASATLTRGGLAGRAAVIELELAIYAIHMCTINTRPIKALSPSDLQWYRQTETIPTGFNPGVAVSPFHRPLANASCARNQAAVVVIGGVFLDTGAVSNEVWTFDTASGLWAQVQHVTLPQPVMHAAVGWDTASIYIVSGALDAAGAVSRAAARLVLQHNRPTTMCRIELVPVPVEFLARDALDHSVVIFGGGAVLYLPSGSTRVATLLWDKQKTAWETVAADIGIAPAVVDPGTQCVSTDTGHLGTVVSAAIMRNDTGAQLHLFRVGGLQNVSCGVNYTTTTATTTTTPTTTTATTTTTNATTTATTTTATTTITTPPPAPTSTTAAQRTAAATRWSWSLAPSRQLYVSRTSLARPAPMLSGAAIPTTATFSVNTSIDPDLVNYCNSSASQCQYRLSTRLSCMSDGELSTAAWYLSDGTPDLTFVVPPNQFPLFICFTANAPDLAECTPFGRHQRLPYDILNRLQPLSTMGDAAAPTPAPGARNGAEPPLISQGGIVGISIAGACFVVVAGLAYSQRMRADADPAAASASSNMVRDSRYEFLESLGEGAFGKVVRVRRRCDDEILALKYIEIPTSRDMHDALHEFEVTRQLQDFPTIIRIHDMFLNYEVSTAAATEATRRSRERRGSSNSGGHAKHQDQHHQRRTSLLDAETHPLLQRKSSAAASAGGGGVGDGSSSRPVSTSAEESKPKRMLCLVMDYHPDGDLKHWILSRWGAKSNAVAPEPVLSHMALQLLRTLDFLHSKGVMHRDLKPENVLIARPDADVAPVGDMFQRIVVTDFGLAKMHEIQSDGILFGGTAAYAAPEQLRLLEFYLAQVSAHNPPRHSGLLSPVAASSPVEPMPPTAHLQLPGAALAPVAEPPQPGAPADIWSLGCVLFACMTKKLTPTKGLRELAKDLARGGGDEAPFSAQLQAEMSALKYSAPFVALVLAMLRRDPRDRVTAADALRYLRKSTKDQTYYVSARAAASK